MKTVISTDEFANYTISGADDIFIVEHGVTLSSTSGVTIKGTGNVDGRLIRIDGSVTSNDNAIHIQNSTATGGDTVRVSATGYVSSGTSDDSVRMEVANAKLFNSGVLDGRVYLSGNGSKLANSGTIVDGSSGAILVGNNTVADNTGTINGWNNIGLYVSGENCTISNSGTIAGKLTGIEADTNNASGVFKIVNSGTIVSGEYSSINMDVVDTIRTVLNNSGKLDGSVTLDEGNDRVTNSGIMQWGFDLAAGNDRLVNTGKIVGMATLGDGNDTLVALKGNTKEALIDGGDGNDTFFVNAKTTQLHEAGGMGYDTVKTTGSFTLAENFEKLVLLGNRNINATGNGEANDLVGNAGSNNLKGLGGADELSGGRGADALTGGSDADLFIFAKGFGNDRVTDFENGLDKFDLKGWDEVKNFADLKANHLTVDNGDLIISAGNDSLTIEDTARKELSDGDFLF